MAFRIQLHEAEGILEVAYPRQPTGVDVEDYARKIKKYIDDLERKTWSCLVDQTELQVMDPTHVERIAELNAYAQARGMLRAARVVASAVGRLQSQRVMREAALRTEFRMFSSREEALSWLKQPPSTPSLPPDRGSSRKLV
jgi:hypothetical protein